MTINGEAVVEIDLRASYLTIFHAGHGKQLDADTDPYVIPELGEGARDVVKLWVAATFGNITPLRKWPSDLLRNYEAENGRPLDRKRYPVAKLRESKDALRAASVNEDINDAITGHSGGNAVARGYGWKDMVRRFGFQTLSDAVEKVRYPGLDLCAIRWTVPPVAPAWTGKRPGPGNNRDPGSTEAA
jgi:hypothetical protein